MTDTDWQVSHTEPDGLKAHKTVVINMADDPDDAGALSVTVRGRGNEAFATKLAAMLQSASSLQQWQIMLTEHKRRGQRSAFVRTYYAAASSAKEALAIFEEVYPGHLEQYASYTVSPTNSRLVRG